MELGRGLNLFRHAENASEQTSITVELTQVFETQGLEFVRSLNRDAMVGVILTPTVASLVFAVVWISVFLHNGTHSNSGGAEPQAVVTTAFTVAIYLVTTGTYLLVPQSSVFADNFPGALITELLAYIDDNLRVLESA